MNPIFVTDLDGPAAMEEVCVTRMTSAQREKSEREFLHPLSSGERPVLCDSWHPSQVTSLLDEIEENVTQNSVLHEVLNDWKSLMWLTISLHQIETTGKTCEKIFLRSRRMKEYPRVRHAVVLSRFKVSLFFCRLLEISPERKYWIVRRTPCANSQSVWLNSTLSLSLGFFLLFLNFGIFRNFPSRLLDSYDVGSFEQ